MKIYLDDSRVLVCVLCYASYLQVAKLWWLVGKVTTKQTLRFADKEFNRSGTNTSTILHTYGNAVSKSILEYI